MTNTAERFLQLDDFSVSSASLNVSDFQVVYEPRAGGGWIGEAVSAVKLGGDAPGGVSIVRLVAVEGEEPSRPVELYGGFVRGLAIEPSEICGVRSYLNYNPGVGIYGWGTREMPVASNTVLVAIHVTAGSSADHGLNLLAELMTHAMLGGERILDCDEAVLAAQLQAAGM